MIGFFITIYIVGFISTIVFNRDTRMYKEMGWRYEWRQTFTDHVTLIFIENAIFWPINLLVNLAVALVDFHDERW